MQNISLDQEYYQGYSKTCSFYEFLKLHRDTIVSSPPFSNDWEGLETAWVTRFLRVINEIISNNYEVLEEKVKSEIKNKSLKPYWDDIIRERKELSVENIHIAGGLDLLGRVGKHNVRKLGSKYPEDTEEESSTAELVYNSKRKLISEKDKNGSVKKAKTKEKNVVEEKEADDQSLFSVDNDEPSTSSFGIGNNYKQEQRRTRSGRIVPDYKGLDMPMDKSRRHDTIYTSEGSDSDLSPSEIAQEQYIYTLEGSDGDLSPSEIAQEQYVKKKVNPIVIQNNSSDISLSLISIMEKYCKKNSTSKFDPANSYILGLSSKSKIAKEFTPECWSKLIADRPNVVTVEYHEELEVIFKHLFGKQIKKVQQARVKWENLRSIEAPEYKEFSYGIDELKKILWWIERAVGQFLDAFETERNPLLHHNCHEREFLGSYLVPIFQGALALNGRFRVPWGEVTVQASLQRRNNNKIILEEK